MNKTTQRFQVIKKSKDAFLTKRDFDNEIKMKAVCSILGYDFHETTCGYIVDFGNSEVYTINPMLEQEKIMYRTMFKLNSSILSMLLNAA